MKEQAGHRGQPPEARYSNDKERGLRGGGGESVNDFSGTSILSNEFLGASTDNLGVLLGLRAKCGPFGHRWLKKSISERKDIEFKSF